MIYEILDETGKVINTIIADEEFVEENYAGRYRLVGPNPPLPPVWVISKIAFRLRLTDEEFAGILSAAKTDSEVQAWYETFNMTTVVDLKSQRVNSGMANLVNKNLLTQARVDEILSVPAQTGEAA